MTFNDWFEYEMGDDYAYFKDEEFLLSGYCDGGCNQIYYNYCYLF